ncbi:hypothetical protein CDL15_Pgr008695 [Punica granatum]|uniref:Uncharacterized protein n=1 Tax=Punica granatum TaxID=22663 RepID=A0A218WCL4_PUNGR|nr:hypothetical protein CDL15_Pgr008695 [Punica granatum]
MDCSAKIVNRFLEAQVYSPFGCSAQLDQFIEFTVSKRANPGNLPARDLRVVKWQVVTPSHVRPSRIPEKVDTPKPRCIGLAHACPDEIKFGCAQLGDSTGDVITTGVTPLPDSSTSQDGGRRSRRRFRRSQPFGPNPLSTTADTCSATSYSCRRTPGVFRHPSDASPAPGTFRDTSATDLTNFRRH